ncbi:MAG TPA: pilus assembly protein TadG-related protein [Acidimicrobiales bacterium]|nr:pilus assembly protein TadG-related protein [Acidimicrobiales bacterium]
MSGRVRDERGQLTLFVVFATVGLLVLAGLVVDGGYVLAGRRRAIDEANGAARAGAQALAPSAYRAGGDVVLDPAAATAAAQDYLAAAGHSGSIQVDGDRVSVSLTFSQPMTLLQLIGISDVDVSGHGEARSIRGIETGEGL